MNAPTILIANLIKEQKTKKNKQCTFMERNTKVGKVEIFVTADHMLTTVTMNTEVGPLNQQSYHLISKYARFRSKLYEAHKLYHCKMLL